MGRWLTLTGLHQNRLSACKTRKRMPKDHSVFGLDLPPTARRPLGLDASPATAVGIGVPQPGPASWTRVIRGTPPVRRQERRRL
jgi:hypothetical protein